MEKILKEVLKEIKELKKEYQDRFLSPEEVTKLTGYSLKALSNNRSQKTGFPFYKYGKKIFYKRSEVLAEIDKYKVGFEEQE